MTLHRYPVQIVEIDIDFCARVYGTAPCTAALSADDPAKCFNTFATCQDSANYSGGTLTLRFARPQGGLPKGTLIYPALRSVSTNPAEINMGGIDDRTGPLGKRARVTIELTDFPDNDIATDKYQAERVSGAAQFSGVGYDPEARGTFFARLLARWPYWLGRSLRVLEGYEGEALASMRTRHYVIAEWEGPDTAGGSVRIVAKDVLDLAENEKALCPAPSQGTLAADLAASGLGDITLEPSGIGAEYASSGRAAIGSEIFSFTRSGDVMTLTARALDGSEASTHSTGDLVQQCYRVENAFIGDVAADLLQNFAGVSAGFLPTTDWDDEGAWLAGFPVTATIPRPTGVTKLLGELAQHGVFWWWDEVNQKVRMRANRPVTQDETVQAFTDEYDVIAGSLSRADLHKQRLTQVLVYHGMLDATGGVDDPSNYARVHVGLNDGASADQYGQDRMAQIFTRWMGSGNNNAAGAIAARLATRYEDAPVQVKFGLDAKDRANVSPADLITLATRAIQDATGQSPDTEMQVTSVEETQAGHALQVVAVSHQFSGRWGYIMANTANDYDSATDAEKNFGAYIMGTGMSDFGDGTGPYLIF